MCMCVRRIGFADVGYNKTEPYSRGRRFPCRCPASPSSSFTFSLSSLPPMHTHTHSTEQHFRGAVESGVCRKYERMLSTEIRTDDDALVCKRRIGAHTNTHTLFCESCGWLFGRLRLGPNGKHQHGERNI